MYGHHLAHSANFLFEGGHMGLNSVLNSFHA